MKDRGRITREDNGTEVPVGDTKLTKVKHYGPTLNPFKGGGNAQVGNAEEVGTQVTNPLHTEKGKAT